MERSFVYFYVGNLINRFLRKEIQTDDIEAARQWQLQLYNSGKFDKLLKTEDKSRCQELKLLTKQDLIERVMKLENHTLRTPSIHLLPKKTIHNILSLLPLNDLVSASWTCKRWRRIARREFHWKTIVFAQYEIRGPSLDLLLSNGTKKLVINNCSFFSPTFEGNPPAEYLLESLTLDTNICIATSKYLLSLLKRCRRLKYLNLHSINVTNQICIEISKNVGLQTLKMHAHTGNLQRGLLQIFKSCKRLETLGYFNLSEPLSEEEIFELIQEIPSPIQELDMFCLQPSLRDYHIALLVKKCPNIISLNLRGCYKISAETIIHLRQLPELQFLNIAWCFGKINEWQRTSRSRSKFLYIGVPFEDSLEKLEECRDMVKRDIMRMLPGVEITLQP